MNLQKRTITVGTRIRVRDDYRYVGGDVHAGDEGVLIDYHDFESGTIMWRMKVTQRHTPVTGHLIVDVAWLFDDEFDVVDT